MKIPKDINLKDWEKILDTIPDLVFILNLDYEIKWLNNAMAKKLRLPKEKVVDQNPYRVLLGLENVPEFSPFKRLLEDGKEHSVEIYLDILEGYYLISATPLKNEKEKLVGAIIIARDITESKKAEEEIKYQSTFNRLLIDISTKFINIPDNEIDVAIQDALRKIGVFFNIDRTYIFEYEWEKRICCNTYEWCAEGISSEKDNLQEVPIDEIPWWVNKHKKGEVLFIPDVLALEESNGVRKILEPQKIKSLIAIPMMNGNDCIGFVGFDAVRKHYDFSKSEIQLLRLFAQLLVNIKLRQEIIEKLINTREKVEESEKQFRLLYENTPLGTCILLPDGRIISANKAQLKIFGFSSEEELKEINFLKFPISIESGYADKFRECVENSEIERIELNYKSKLGKQSYLSSYLVPLKDPKGKVEKVFILTEDITERKRAEALIEESRMMYEAIFESGTATLLVDEDATIIAANKECLPNIGYSIEELIGTRWFKYFTHDSVELMLKYQKMRKENPEKVPRKYEVKLVRKNGEERIVIIDVALIPGTKRSVVTMIDITERKKAEEEIKENQRRLKVLMSNLPGMAYRCKNVREWTMQFVSDGCFDLCGYKPEELIDNRVISYNDLIKPEDRDWIWEAWQQKLKLREKMTLEYEIICKDGTVKWVWEQGQGVFNNQGELEALEGFIMDITERKKAEIELENQKNRLSNVIEATNIGTWEWNIQTGETWFNSRWAELIGYTLDEISPVSIKTWEKYAHPDDLKRNYELIEAHFRGEIPYYECEARLRHKNGNWVWILDKGKVVSWSEDGKPLMMFGVHIDITERKKAEEEIKTLAHAMRSIGECVSVTDIDDNLIFVNEAFLKTYGYNLEELIGKPMSIVRSSKNPPELLAEILPATLHGGWQGELWNRKKDGTDFPIYLSTSIIRDEYGKTIALIGVARDITDLKKEEEDKKKLQEQLVQSQKIESIGRLAGGVAHDFNNMLGVILGYADLTLQRIEPSNKIHSYIEQIKKAAERSANIIRQLLAFARKQTVSPKVLNINETIDNMLKMLHRLIGEDIELKYIPGDNIGLVYIDPSQVDQILANLCVNARDAITGNGRIIIETSKVIVDESYKQIHPDIIPGEYVRLTVSDNGCGMDSETMSHLFEPFYTTKEMGKGTGLGLSTVYGIVKQNKGYINVYSEPGVGTTFKIYLPVCEVKEKNVEKKVEEEIKIGIGGGTILLVEDEQGILEMTTDMLIGLGYRVITARNGREAIRIIKERGEKIDILITDVIMPEKSGKELEKEIREIEPEIRCIFMSGYTSDFISRHNILEEGINFIQKPFTIEELAKKIEEVMNKPY